MAKAPVKRKAPSKRPAPAARPKAGAKKAKAPAKRAAPAKKGAKPKPKAKDNGRASRSVSPDTSQETISIRKIQNGYVVRESKYVEDRSGGHFVETEIFTKTKPTIKV